MSSRCSPRRPRFAVAIKHMLERRTGGSIVNITTSLVDQPVAGLNVAVPVITKGGLEAVTRSLAMEYVKQGVRVNAVAPGIVDTPMHRNDPKDFLRTLQPMGRIADVSNIVSLLLEFGVATFLAGHRLIVEDYFKPKNVACQLSIAPSSSRAQ